MEKAYFKEKSEKNLSIPLFPEIIEDRIIAEGIDFKQDKKKQIKK